MFAAGAEKADEFPSERIDSDHDKMTVWLQGDVRGFLDRVPAEQAECAAGFDQTVEGPIVEDHVGRDRDGDESDQCGDGEDGWRDQPRPHAHGDEDEGEFADLRHGDGGEERRPLPVAHAENDPDENDGIANDDEKRKEQDGSRVLEGGGQLHLHPEGNKEDRDEEIHQRVHAPPEVVVVGELGQAEAGEKGADLEREAEKIRGKHDEEAPTEAPDHVGFRAARSPGEGSGQQPACRAKDEDEEGGDPGEGFDHAGRCGRGVHRPRAEAGEKGQHDDGDKVLHEEDADRDAAVECVHLVFLIEEFDHNDGAAEGEGGGEESGFDPIESQQHAQPVTDDRGENHLADTGHHRDLPHVPHLLEAQFETDDEKKQGDADFRDQLKGVGNLDQPGERADDQPGQHIGHDGRHADPAGGDREKCAPHDDESQTAEEKLVGHGSIISVGGWRRQGCGAFRGCRIRRARQGCHSEGRGTTKHDG